MVLQLLCVPGAGLASLQYALLFQYQERQIEIDGVPS